MARLKDLIIKIEKLAIRGATVFMKNNMAAFSGYATLFVVIAAIPFITLIISIVNMLPWYSTEDAMSLLLNVLPDLEAFDNVIKDLMTDVKTQSGGLVALISAVTALWAASKGVYAIQQGLDQLYGNVQSKETVDQAISFIQSIMKRLFCTVMLLILFPAFLVFEMLGDSILDLIRSVLEKVEPAILGNTIGFIEDIFDISALLIIPFALIVVILIYTILPAVHQTIRSQLPGALLTVLCWVVFTAFFAFFIPRLYNASNLYGSLASLFLVLMWLRYMIVILFAGSVLNRTLQYSHMADTETPS